jgi:alpha-beta hydrolase superfamily lysophospholipase
LIATGGIRRLTSEPFLQRMPMKTLLALASAALLGACAAPRTTDVSANAGASHFLAKDGVEISSAAADGSSQRGLLWRAHGTEHGVIVCLHGLQTHSAWFGPLAAELNQRGWTVFAPDRRGSGLNADLPNHRGHTKGSDELLEDLQAHMRTATALAKRKPVILLGTSWGSNVATAYVTSRVEPRARALVQLVPATEVQKPVAPSLAKQLGALVLNVVAPGKTQPPPFGPDHYLAGQGDEILDDPAHKPGNDKLRRILQKDTVLLKLPTVRTYVTGQILAKRWKIELAAKPATSSVLLIVAKHDRIMDNTAAMKAAQIAVPYRLEGFDGGHGGQITHPGEIAGYIARWARAVR